MSTAIRARSRGRFRRLDQSNPLVGYGLLVPYGVLFVLFTVYPLIDGIVISVQRWNPLQDTQPWVGGEFYAQLFDPQSTVASHFWGSLLNTCVFAVISVPLLIAVALGLAVLVNRPVKGRSFFRSVFFLPTILSVSVISLLWKWIFQDGIGLVPVLLGQLGLRSPQFLSTEGWVWVPIVVSTLWWSVGLNMMLYLAGLAGIPESYDEAAQLDGANARQRFQYITLPLLAPTTLFVSVTTVLTAFQMFGQSQIITGGGPASSTTSVLMYITTQAFTNNQISSATAMSFVFGILMLAITVLQFTAMARGARGSS